MLSIALVFFLTTLICFAASLQPSPVSIGIMKAASKKMWSYTWYKTFGGVIAEAFYAALAILIAELIYRQVGGWSLMEYFGPLIMIGFGVYLIYAANKKFIRGRRHFTDRSHPFISGFVLGFMNPQIFLFYSGLLLAFYQFGIKPEHAVHRMFAFVSGAMLGLFLMLSLIIYLVKRRGGISHQFTGRRIMIFSGVLIIIVGLYQFISAL
jgi:threonine/homoserine/homoserine lactone efflux protein